MTDFAVIGRMPEPGVVGGRGRGVGGAVMSSVETEMIGSIGVGSPNEGATLFNAARSAPAV